MGKLMYMDKTYSSTVENCTGLKYDNASSGLDAENVQDAIDETNSNLSQLSNPNIFINGNFQIWSNGESFEVFGTNNEGTTTVICDKWYAKHYDLENNYYITKAGAQGIRLFSASEVPCYIYQILDEETFNALQGKTVTLSWSYTQSYGDANHVEYETIEESEQILVGTDLDVFTAMTKIGFTNGIAGCIVHWIKLEVGELKTPCVPDSKDAIICKLEQEVDELKDKLTNKTTWKFLGEATNGNKLTLPNPDDYEDLLIVVSSSDVDTNCKYTFSLCKYLIENFYTGAFEYLKQGSHANEFYYSETIVEFSNSKNGNYVKLNSVKFQGNDIGGAIQVCYR